MADIRHMQEHVGTGEAHTIAVLAAHVAPPMELAVISAIFGAPHLTLKQDLHDVSRWYELREITADDLVEARTVIVAADADIPPDPTLALQHALRSAHAAGTRIVAIGSGAFVLAAAGLLDGRRATAHWSVLDELRHRHPEVLVDGCALYTEDGGIYTSAGAAATLDVCLELVRQDHGAAVADALARWMIAPLPRSGEQQQYVTGPAVEKANALAHVLDWASARLDQPLTLADLAQAAGVSPRTLARRFHTALGTTPVQWLLAQRIRLAQHLLESTGHSVEQIAVLSGLGSSGNMRQKFTRALGIPPRRYRREFTGNGGGMKSADRLSLAPGKGSGTPSTSEPLFRRAS